MFLQNKAPSCGEAFCNGHIFKKMNSRTEKRKSIPKKDQQNYFKVDANNENYSHSLLPKNLSLRPQKIELTDLKILNKKGKIWKSKVVFFLEILINFDGFALKLAFPKRLLEITRDRSNIAQASLKMLKNRQRSPKNAKKIANKLRYWFSLSYETKIGKLD